VGARRDRGVDVLDIVAVVVIVCMIRDGQDIERSE
jgi:hypothetical protein